MRRVFQVIWLAYKDWKAETWLIACSIIALASIFAPILTFHGIHFGVISALQQRLLSDPSVLVVVPTGTKGGGFDKEFINELAKKEDVSYVIGRMRDVASEIHLEGSKEHFLTLTLEATSLGDPLLERSNLQPPKLEGRNFEGVLTQGAARKLGVTVGQVVKASMSRRGANGKIDSEDFQIKVIGLIPSSVVARDVLFVPPSLLSAVQDYRDNVSSAVLGIRGEKPESKERYYESFRLYAKNLDAVQELETWFEKRGIKVSTKAKEIANLKQLDQTVQKIIFIVSTLSFVGFVAFIGSTIFASVERKETLFGLLRLLGLSRGNLIFFPVTQSVLTTVAGTVLSFSFYFLAASLINFYFESATQNTPVCLIPPLHFLFILFGVVTIALISIIPAAAKAFNADPSAAVRKL